MERMIIAIIAAAVGLALGGVAGYYYFRYRSKLLAESAEQRAERIIAEADTKAKETILQAREQIHKEKAVSDREIKGRERELRHEEDRLQRQRARLDERFEQLDNRDRHLNQRQSAMDKRFNKLEQLEKERLDELERVSNMSQEEARQLLLTTVEAEARQDMARVIREIEQGHVCRSRKQPADIGQGRVIRVERIDGFRGLESVRVRQAPNDHAVATKRGVPDIEVRD